MIIDDPWFYAAAVPAVLLAGISKAGFGGAVGALAVPLMALTVLPTVAVVIMLPILCLFDLMGMVTFRGKVDWRILKVAIPAGLVGTLIGYALFRHVDAQWVRAIIGFEAVLFALTKLFEGRLAWSGPPKPFDARQAGFWSTVSGFTSFISHAGGPPMMQFMLPMRLDKVIFVGTMAWYFSFINAAKWIPYSMLGLLDANHFGTSLALLPAVPVGYFLGLKLLRRIPPELFIRLITWAMLVTGLKLLWDAFT